MESSLQTYRREDGILVFAMTDTTSVTVRHWEEEVMKALDNVGDKDLHLQDFRQLEGLSTFALRRGLAVGMHPNMNRVHVAVLATNTRVLDLARTFLSIMPWRQFRLFSNEEEALAWLHSH